MLFSVFQEHFVTFVTIELTGEQCVVDTTWYAFFAAAIVFEQAGLPVGTAVRLDGQRRDKTPDPAAASLLGYQHVI